MISNLYKEFEVAKIANVIKIGDIVQPKYNYRIVVTSVFVDEFFGDMVYGIDSDGHPHAHPVNHIEEICGHSSNLEKVIEDIATLEWEDDH